MEFLNLKPLDELGRQAGRSISHATDPNCLLCDLGLCLDERNIDPMNQLFCCFPRTRIRCDLELECAQGAIARSALSLEFGRPTLFVLDFDAVAASTRMPKWLRLGRREWQKRLRCLWILLSNQCSFVAVQFDNAERIAFICRATMFAKSEGLIRGR